MWPCLSVHFPLAVLVPSKIEQLYIRIKSQDYFALICFRDQTQISRLPLVVDTILNLSNVCLIRYRDSKNEQHLTGKD